MQALATVLIFVAPGCMLSERARPALAGLQSTYESRGVRFAAVVSGRWAPELLEPWKPPLPLQADPLLKLARQTGVHVTPEAVMLDAKGATRYRGRVDGLGEALEDLLAGRPVRRPFIAATGCAISGLDTQPRINAPGFHDGSFAVLRRHCVECHRSGGAAPFSLVTYADVAPRAAAIAEAVTTRRMPPWKPDPGPPHFLGERRLTPLEIGTLLAWSRAGAPEGKPASEPPPELPPVDQWGLGKPDAIAAMPITFAVPAAGPDLYRCFVIPASLDRAGAECDVHHAAGRRGLREV